LFTRKEPFSPLSGGLAVPGIAIDKGSATEATRVETERFVELLRGGVNPDATAIGHWTAGEVAAHIWHVLGWMVLMARGEPSPLTHVSKISAASDALIASDPERDPVKLATRIEGRAREFLVAVEGREGNPEVTWHGGIRLPLSTLPAIAVEELIVHGRDIARSSGLDWKISQDSARLALLSGSHLLPHFVDPAEARDFRATYRVRVRGGPDHFMVFDGPDLEFLPANTYLTNPISPIPTQPELASRSVGARGLRSDCTISADPVAYLLLGTRRIGLLAPALTGRVITYGRKPWLGLKLKKLFVNP
jgi:hypothetical protein